MSYCDSSMPIVTSEYPCAKTVEMGLGQATSKPAVVSLRIGGCPEDADRERVTAAFWTGTADKTSGLTR